MNINKIDKNNQKKGDIDLQQVSPEQKGSIFDKEFSDKNNDGLVDAFDFDNDERNYNSF